MKKVKDLLKIALIALLVCCSVFFAVLVCYIFGFFSECSVVVVSAVNPFPNNKTGLVFLSNEIDRAKRDETVALEELDERVANISVAPDLNNKELVFWGNDNFGKKWYSSVKIQGAESLYNIEEVTLDKSNTFWITYKRDLAMMICLLLVFGIFSFGAIYSLVKASKKYFMFKQ